MSPGSALPPGSALSSGQPRDVATRRLFTVLATLAVVACGLFLTWDVKPGQWDFALAHRGIRLLALVLVAYAIAVSTVLFQTLVGNRILTPSVIGFDALYVLIQTCLVFGVGLERLQAVDLRFKFLAEVMIMAVLAGALFRWLFSGAARSLFLTLLVGIVFGILFRSLTSFLVRIIDPNEFVVLQDRLFASFNLVARDLLGVSILVVAVVTWLLWRRRHRFDVLGLGSELATNLGIDYRAEALRLLLLIIVLVAVSTALVGPITFFGLLVSNLAWFLLRTERHDRLLPAAVLIGIVLLVGGQFVLERLLRFDTALSVVIEFVGGLTFIILLLRRTRT